MLDRLKEIVIFNYLTIYEFFFLIIEIFYIVITVFITVFFFTIKIKNTINKYISCQYNIIIKKKEIYKIIIEKFYKNVRD